MSHLIDECCIAINLDEIEASDVCPKTNVNRSRINAKTRHLLVCCPRLTLYDDISILELTKMLLT